MTAPTPPDGWLSSDDYTQRAAADVGLRAEATAWMSRLVGWFAANRLMAHESAPVLHGIHWAAAGRQVWLLVTPVDELGTPATEYRGPHEKRRLAMVWAPAPTAPPDRLRALADDLPSGAAVPGVRPAATDEKLIRAPGWKAGIARVNRDLEERRDWWEHRTLGVDAQRERNTGAGTWYDRVREITDGS